MFAFDHIDVPQHGETEKSWQRQQSVVSALASEQLGGAWRFAEKEEQRHKRPSSQKEIGASILLLAPMWRARQDLNL